MATALSEIIRQKLEEDEQMQSFTDSFKEAGMDAGGMELPEDPVKKEQKARRIARAGLIDLLLGVLVAAVAWKYNAGAGTGMRVLTTIFAFFFWQLYALYYLIRVGLLKMTSPLDFGDLSAEFKSASKGLSEDWKKTEKVGGYYY